MTIRRRLKISVSGIRGVVGETFSPMLAADLAESFGEFVGRGLVVVGRDTRASGEFLEHAVCSGLISVGAQVLLLGIVPTPTVQETVRALGASGGIMISASHNATEWNALKLIGPDGFFLDPLSGNDLLDIYNQPDANYVSEQEYRPVKVMEHAFQLQERRIFEKIDCDAIRQAHLKVAVDCCNGVGAVHSRSFLEKMGVEVVSIFDRPDLPFERNPEPIPEHLHPLADLVVQEHCDVGFAQDPDGDRLALVTDDGKRLGVQNSLLPAVAHLLSKKNGMLVIANIQTTRAVEVIAKRHQSKVIYAPVGEVNVTKLMRSLHADFALEGSSGGLIVPDIMPCRDSFTAMALTLEMMAMKQRKLSDLFAELPHECAVERKISVGAQDAINALRMLAARHAKENPLTMDGIRLDFGNSWVLVRSSNTEPILRVTAEAATEKDAQALADSFLHEVQNDLDSIQGKLPG